MSTLTPSTSTTPLTFADLANAFNAHCAALGKPIHCACCSGVDLQFNRLAVLPDMVSGQDAAEECTPIALILCRECLHLMPFAWLPVVESARKSAAATSAGILPTLARMFDAAKNAVTRA